MFCRNCGKEVAPNVEICTNCGVRPANGSKFCQNCGVETQPNQEICVKCGVKLSKPAAANDGNQVLWCILSYLSILSLIPLLTQKDNKFIQFHARQGFALFIIAVAIFVCVIVLSFIPFIGWIFSMLSFFLHLGIFVLSIIGIIKAVQGEEWRIPVVADLAEKINF
jgi:uncharacterized membrane protein/RNA polymerase subunit RPABC4/transcription elongation factor Spt4